MFIFSRAAKFGFFKPSEEMVYLKMDDESRSTGKATVDVIGAQFGKSVSSLMQQILFIISGGSIAKVLPVMLTLFVAMLQQWMSSVKSLAKTMSMDAKADLGGGADDEAGGKIYGVS
jgi:AAA family ATP:ADP antiporter